MAENEKQNNGRHHLEMADEVKQFFEKLSEEDPEEYKKIVTQLERLRENPSHGKYLTVQLVKGANSFEFLAGAWILEAKDPL